MCSRGERDPNRSCQNDCKMGKFMPVAKANFTECDDCVEGKFQDESGMSSCKECAQGKWSDQTGQETKDECKVCQAGKYSKAIGATSHD